MLKRSMHAQNIYFKNVFWVFAQLQATWQTLGQKLTVIDQHCSSKFSAIVRLNLRVQKSIISESHSQTRRQLVGFKNTLASPPNLYISDKQNN